MTFRSAILALSLIGGMTAVAAPADAQGFRDRHDRHYQHRHYQPRHRYVRPHRDHGFRDHGRRDHGHRR